MYDLIIIGGGPAGLTAAIYAARKKINFCILSEEFGGEPNKTSTVENYPGFEVIEGPQLTQKWQKHLESLNPDIKHEKAIRAGGEKWRFRLKGRSFLACFPGRRHSAISTKMGSHRQSRPCNNSAGSSP